MIAGTPTERFTSVRMIGFGESFPLLLYQIVKEQALALVFGTPGHLIRGHNSYIAHSRLCNLLNIRVVY